MKRLFILFVGLLMLTSTSWAGISGGDYGFETITVSTNAIGFTAGKIAPLADGPKVSAQVSIETNNIRIRYDGTNPTSTVGHLITAGSMITLTHYSDIQKFRAIRDTGAVGDATITVTYKRYSADY